jgi:hypothetical protein
MTSTFARIVSFVFHPLLMPTYLFLLFAIAFPVGLEPIPAGAQQIFLILIFIITFVLPVLNVAILKTLGAITPSGLPFKTFFSVTSFMMFERRQRFLPFILTSLIYLAITFLFYWKSRIGLNDNFMKILLIIDLLVVLGTVITFFYKISIHSLAVWGVIGILIPLNKITEVNTLFYPALGAVIIAGFVMSSRLVLQSHTLKEVMWGAIAGLATSAAGMMIFF